VGIAGLIGGVRWQICSPGCAEDAGVLSLNGAAQATADIEQRGQTALVLFSAAEPVAVIGVADQVRPETAGALAALRRIGVKHLVMLTGDNDRVAGAVAGHAGITEFRARLLPEAKTSAVRELAATYGPVAMVGDGINDAPALAAADIGIAMGAAGSDTALETADVALMRDDLTALAGFLDLGRRTLRTIKQNVAFSILVKALFLVLAVTGYATLWMAVFADTGVALLVIVNGMRLLRRHPQV
jgi:Cd2+/Zn2+-exporting ATPase